MIIISEYLRTLGYRPLKRGDSDAGSKFTESLEHEGRRLPEDYKKFLREFPLTGVFDDQIGFNGSEKSPWASNGVEVLECLYAQCSDKRNDLVAVRDQLSNELPTNMLAIGQVTGANFVCICLDQAAFGTIYVWDHEHMNDVRKGIYMIAPSFSKFVELLKKIEGRPIEKQTRLVGVDLSETLKARVEQLKNKRK